MCLGGYITGPWRVITRDLQTIEGLSLDKLFLTRKGHNAILSFKNLI